MSDQDKALRFPTPKVKVTKRREKQRGSATSSATIDGNGPRLALKVDPLLALVRDAVEDLRQPLTTVAQMGGNGTASARSVITAGSAKVKISIALKVSARG